MYLTNGTLLQGGKYKIERYISSGGFGCTYEGVHVLLKKRIAIKEFFVKDFCNRDEATATITVGTTSKAALVQKLKAKFIEEAQAVSELKHPNIVNVYDVFEENGTAYYVMDYIDGSSLDEIIKVHGPLNEQKATEYILQVADALKYVHAKNRLHLDIKPGNIMVGKEGNAVLIDFGSSKQYDEESGENTSTLLGYTPGYAPSEQCAKNVTKFSPATDIYALGATFYKLLTGVTPLEMTLRASGEQLQPLPTTVSKNVRNAISRAMQMNKAERPQSVEEFLEEIKGENTGNGEINDKTNRLFFTFKIFMWLFTTFGGFIVMLWMVESITNMHMEPIRGDVYGSYCMNIFGTAFTGASGILNFGKDFDCTHLYYSLLLEAAVLGSCIFIVGILGLLLCNSEKYKKRFDVFRKNSHRILPFAMVLNLVGLICYWGFAFLSICAGYGDSPLNWFLYLESFFPLVGLIFITTQKRYGFLPTFLLPVLLSYIILSNFMCEFFDWHSKLAMYVFCILPTFVSTLGMFLKRNGKSYWQYCKEVEQ